MSCATLTEWLYMKAEELGVEIFPGFAGSGVIYNKKGALEGVITGDFGITKKKEMGDLFMRGMEIRGKQTLLAEGARGNLTEKVKKDFNLQLGKDP